MDSRRSKPEVEDEENVDFVLYTAPTGKAASVIRKRIKKKAYTIHQVSGD